MPSRRPAFRETSIAVPMVYPVGCEAGRRASGRGRGLARREGGSDARVRARQPGARVPTLADVARHAGVAKSTISRVMSGDRTLSIRDDTRQRILDSVEALGYRPNPSARNLRTARSWSIAYVVPEIDNPIFIQTIHGAERAALERHYSILIAHADTAHPDRDLYHRMVLGNRVEGLLVNTVQDPDLLADLHRLGAPYVLVNRETDRAEHGVILDNEGGVRLAVRHLVELGHRRIGYVSGPTAHYASARRLAGYRSALAEAGMAYDPALFAECQFDRAGAERAAGMILRGGRTAETMPPTAVVAGNLVIASGITAAAASLGIAVPARLSVISLHDVPAAEMMTPRITAVRFPLFDLGWSAANALLDLIEGRIQERIRRVLPPDGITLRDSTGPVPALSRVRLASR